MVEWDSERGHGARTYDPKGGKPFCKAEWLEETTKKTKKHAFRSAFLLFKATFYGFYHGKSPLCHHLGEYLSIFSNRLKQIQIFFVLRNPPFYHLFLGPDFGQVGENISPKTRKLCPQAWWLADLTNFSFLSGPVLVPIPSMYGILTYIYHHLPHDTIKNNQM